MRQRLHVDGDIFENAPRLDADIFLYGYKKMLFQKYPDTCGRGLRAVPNVVRGEKIQRKV